MKKLIPVIMSVSIFSSVSLALEEPAPAVGNAFATVLDEPSSISLFVDQSRFVDHFLMQFWSNFGATVE